MFWVAALCIGVAHIGGGTQWVLSSTMLQLLTPDRLRGRIFAIDFGLNTVTNALSTFVVGAAVERWDARVVAAGMSAVFIVYAFVWGAAVLISQRLNVSAWTNRASASVAENVE